MTGETSKPTVPSSSLSLDHKETIQSLPSHVAIIMDGNGRWARDHGWPRSQGHRAGTENIRRIVKSFIRYEVKYLTLFTFSTENWNRPDDEVDALMNLLREAISKDTPRLHKEGVRIRHIGRLDRLSTSLRDAISESIELTKNNRVMTLSVAFDYGGRAEIIDAVRAIVRDGLAPADINNEVFKRYLYTNGLPDPDLVIRTSGEMRLSNFLLWQMAYSEYYSTPVRWPDFDEVEITKALAAYSQRQRRYGSLSPGGDPV